MQYERLPKLCFQYGNWDQTLLSCPSLPPNASKAEKDEQEYGLWLGVDAKFHEDSKLLLTADLDNSRQIIRINNIRANYLEKPVPRHLFVEARHGKDEQSNNHLQRQSDITLK